MTGRTVVSAINARLPDSVRVVMPGSRAEHVSCAVPRAIEDLPLSHLERYVMSPFEQRYAWHLPAPRSTSRRWPLRRALLVGRHDFAAMQAAGSDVVSTERDGAFVAVSARPSGPSSDAWSTACLPCTTGPQHHRYIVYEVSGRRFSPPHGAHDCRHSRRESDVGATAPAHGSVICSTRRIARAPDLQRRQTGCSSSASIARSAPYATISVYREGFSACRLSSSWRRFLRDPRTIRWRVRSTSSSCPRMSPSSWTATAAGPRSGICRASRATAPASTRSATSSRPPARLGIPVLTLYAFSVENWKRPRAEVSTLMMLLKRYIRLELDTLNRNNIRFRVIGRSGRTRPRRAEGAGSSASARPRRIPACCSTSR